jgi:hypothetical protein
MVRQMPQALLRCTIQVSPVYCMKPRCVNNKQVWQHRTSRHVNRWVGGSNRSCLKMASMLFHGRFHGKRHHSQHQNHRSHHRTPLSCGRACKHTSGERASERACVRVCVSACVLPSVRDVACCAVRVLAHLRARMHARRHKGAQTCAFETREREGGGKHLPAGGENLPAPAPKEPMARSAGRETRGGSGHSKAAWRYASLLCTIALATQSADFVFQASHGVVLHRRSSLALS